MAVFDFIPEKAELTLENYFNLDPEVFDKAATEKILLQEKIDMEEGYGAKLRPVFIVLIYSGSTFTKVAEKFVKDQKYWHAAIAFGPGLTNLYSFNFNNPATKVNKFKGGLSFENVNLYKQRHPDGTMEVSCILLGSRKYKALKETLDYYIQHKEKTRYSFLNLAYSLFGHKTPNGKKFNLVCSTFVDTILKSIDINIGNDSTNLTKPDDLRADKKREKQFKVFEGKIVDYKPASAARKVEKIANDENNNYFKKTKKK